MTSTVPCPDCDRPATVLGRFTAHGPDGPAEYLRVRCSGALSLLVAVDPADARVTAGASPGLNG